MNHLHPVKFHARLSGALALIFASAQPSAALVLRVFDPADHLRMNGFPNSPMVNPTFLNSSGAASTLLDLTGVGWSVQDPTKQFTLVSPRHFVGANHFRPGVGSSVRFLAKDNSLHTFTVAKISAIPNADASASDVFLGEFSTEVPASIPVLPMPYLNLATETAYVGEAIVVVGQAARGGRGNIASVSDFGGDPITGGAGIKTRAFTFSYGPIGAPDDAHAEGGDSGSPSFAVRNNKAALVGTHTAVLSALGSFTTYDTLVPHYVPELNSRMETTGFRMRKISPPATSFSATGAATDAIVRTGMPFTYRINLTNAAAIADNVTADLALPPGVAISAISSPGWFETGAMSLRRGGVAAGEVVRIDVTFPSAPDPGTLQMILSVKSDGSALQQFPLSLEILPSFAGWAAGLEDATLTGDSDLDGISNLIEYATGGDNRTNSQIFPGSGPGELLLPVLSGNPLHMSFLRRTDAGGRGLVYRLETSGTLNASSWEILDVPFNFASSPGTGFERVEAAVPLTDGKSFYRLRIELTE